MRLEINGEEIFFKLENEKILLDFVTNVMKYMRDNGFLDLRFEIDGRAISFEKGHQWGDRCLSDVECVRVTGQAVYDFVQCLDILACWKNIFEFSQEIQSIKKEELFGICPRLVLSLRFWLVDFHLEDNYFVMVADLPGFFQKGGCLSELGFRKKIVELFDLFLRMMYEKERELEQPRQELFLVLDRLKVLRSLLMDLSILFQDGKDAKALQGILDFMELFSKLIRIIKFSSQNVSVFRDKMVQIIKDLSGKIHDLTQACEFRDYILASDLAEYEIVPELEKLDEFEFKVF